MKKSSDTEVETRIKNEPNSYFYVSKSWSMSLVFILPLVVLYQIGIVQGGSQVRNLAEIWLTDPIALLGVPATAVINALLLIGVFGALLRLKRTGTLSVAYAAFMTLESLLYSLLLFTVVGFAARWLDQNIQNLLATGWIAEQMQSLPRQSLLLGIGAAVYEELLFRVMLIAGGAFILRKAFRINRPLALLIMLIISSLLFSAAHHVGAMGEPMDRFVFIFRALCGLLLGIIYITRGPGIPVMTHALYNVLVIILFQSGV